MAPPSSALQALAAIGRHRGLGAMTAAALDSAHGLGGRAPSLRQLTRIARAEGLNARRVKVSWSTLMDRGVPFPALVPLTDGRSTILVGVKAAPDGARAVLVDPARDAGEPELLPQGRFESLWDGTLILLTARRDPMDPNQPYGPIWFLPRLATARRPLIEAAALAAAGTTAAALLAPLAMVAADRVAPSGAGGPWWGVAAMAGALGLFMALVGALGSATARRGVGRVMALVAAEARARLQSLPLGALEHGGAMAIETAVRQLDRLRHLAAGRPAEAASAIIGLPVPLLLLAILAPHALPLAALGVLGAAAIAWGVWHVSGAEAASGAASEAEVDTRTARALRALPLTRALASPSDRAAEPDLDTPVPLDPAARGRTVATLGRLAATLWVALAALAAWATVGDATPMGREGAFGLALAAGLLTYLIGRPAALVAAAAPACAEMLARARLMAPLMTHHPTAPPTTPPPRIDGRVTVAGLTFRHRQDGPPTLDGLTFSLEPGTLLGVFGRNGAGKSTLLRLLDGSLAPSRGSIRLDDLDALIEHPAHRPLLAHRVDEVPLLTDGTVAEVIAAARPDRGASPDIEAVVAAAEAVGALPAIDRLPRGFETVSTEGGAALSPGVRQVLALARAALSPAPLLLLDDPTSAMDAELEATVLARLRGWTTGRTVILASRRPTVLSAMDTILVLDGGRAIDLAPHAVLARRCPPYRRHWERAGQPLEAAR